MLGCYFREYYFTKVAWQDDSHVMIAWSNRAQNMSIISICDAESADCHVVCPLLAKSTAFLKGQTVMSPYVFLQNQIEIAKEGGWVQIVSIFNTLTYI